MKDIDFGDIKLMYEGMKNGPKADIRRVKSPEDLLMTGAYYSLLPKGERPSSQWNRIIFFLPWASSSKSGNLLGQIIKKNNVSEQRLFQMVRSEYPLDIIHLRRIVQHVNPKLDWSEFGKLLYFWGDISKRQIVMDYFLPSYDKLEEGKNE